MLCSMHLRFVWQFHPRDRTDESRGNRTSVRSKRAANGRRTFRGKDDVALSSPELRRGPKSGHPGVRKYPRVLLRSGPLELLKSVIRPRLADFLGAKQARRQTPG